MTFAAPLATFLAQSSGDAAGGVAFAGMGLLVLFLWAIALLSLVFTIWMLIDCLTSALPTNEKLIWVVVILFLNGLGAILYFFLGRGKRMAG